MLVLAGCGGGEEGRTAVAPSPTPPDSDTLKYDILTAKIQLDAHKLTEGRFTADERELGEAFPPTVTIKTADATSFYIAARDDKGIRYTLIIRDGVTERECDPPTEDACPDGKW